MYTKSVHFGAGANSCSAMGAGTIQKTRASLKSQKSRGYRWKRVLLAAIVAVWAWTPTQAQDYELSDDCALIHIYRVGSMKGAAVGYDLHLDDETVIFRVKNKSKTTIKVTEAGLKTLWAKTEKRVDLPVEAKLGQEYYVRCSIKMGALVGRPFLELVDAKTGKSEYDAIPAGTGAEQAKSAKSESAKSEAKADPAAKSSSQVQRGFKQNFGIRGGFNFTNLRYSGEGGSIKGSMKVGIQLGVTSEFVFSESFSLQYGVLFSQQGTAFREEGGTSKTVLNYLQSPWHGMYKFNVENVKLMVHAGPYVGVGLWGKEKWSSDGESGSSPIKFYEGGYYQPVDFGLGLGAAVEFSSFRIGIGYNFGLFGIERRADLIDSNKTTNTGMSLTLTYFPWKN